MKWSNKVMRSVRAKYNKYYFIQGQCQECLGIDHLKNTEQQQSYNTRI